MGKLITTLTLERRDEHNHEIEKRVQQSRSWTKKLIDFLYVMSGYNSNTVSSTDYSGTSRTLNLKSANLQVCSPPGDTILYPYSASPTLMLGHNVGIVVGSGSTAVTPTDNSLATVIPQGKGQGQLLYDGTNLYGIVFSNPNGSFNIQRYFTNSSGDSITINEVGIYAVGLSAYPFCICRDLVSPGVTVANGQILNVVYTPQITV
jgi:hypothetical protein